MQLWITGLHFLFSFVSTPSMADEIPAVLDENTFIVQMDETLPEEDKIDPNQIAILGRGIKERKGERILALACVGDQLKGTEQKKCDRLRWILFTGTSRVEYISPTLQLTSLRTLNEDGTLSKEYTEAIEQYLKKISKDAKTDYFKSRDRAILLGGLIPLGAAFWIAGASTLPPAIIIGAAYPLLVPIGKAIVAPKLALSSHGTVKVADHNGWSWSSRPKNVNSRYFESILEQIDKTTKKPTRPTRHLPYGTRN